MVKVVKFGGSSLADAEHFRMVERIILEEPERRYVVPSAPGKRFSSDTKVTDMLYECYQIASQGDNIDASFAKIVDRYNSIIEGLGIELDLSKEFESIKTSFALHAGRDYAASRGEYLNGLILAKLLGFDFIDAAKVVRFAEDGTFDDETTDKILNAELDRHYRAVIPGFYGSMPNGTIKTFSRGGSDITGSIVARAARATIYENWTDVSGYLMTDPRIVDSPCGINNITYHEMRELSYMGAGVLHEDSIFPVRAAKIPINIRNTNDPSVKGTMIVPNGTDIPDEAHIITGIAGRKGFTILNIEKAHMNSEIGFGRRVLSAIESEGITFEHLPSGIDTMSVVLSGEISVDQKNRILNNICATCLPEYIGFEGGLALIAVVGRGMVHNKGTAAKVFSAVADANINIRMIDQGSSEINIILGVDEKDFETALRAIYDKFVKH